MLEHTCPLCEVPAPVTTTTTTDQDGTKHITLDFTDAWAHGLTHDINFDRPND
jgi:hypothetical protein